jgi:hypothetical protein
MGIGFQLFACHAIEQFVQIDSLGAVNPLAH